MSHHTFAKLHDGVVVPVFSRLGKTFASALLVAKEMVMPEVQAAWPLTKIPPQGAHVSKLGGADLMGGF